VFTRPHLDINFRVLWDFSTLPQIINLTPFKILSTGNAFFREKDKIFIKNFCFLLASISRAIKSENNSGVKK